MYVLTLMAAVAAATTGPEIVTDEQNALLLRDGSKILAVYGDPRPGRRVDLALVASARRDTVWAAAGAKGIAAPAREVALIENPVAYWREFWDKARYHDYGVQGIKWPARAMQPERAVRALREGETLKWGDARVTVLETPGYTRGAVSYLVESGGRRVACTGDLIFEDGKLADIYSLQDAIPELKVRGYHGYAARAAELIASLGKVAAWKPDVILPVRGPAIHDPQAAIGRLTTRLRAVYANYLRTDAYRWYFGDANWRERARRVLGDHEATFLERAEIVSERPPEWIRVIGNSRLVVSRTGAALLVDAGYSRLDGELDKLRASGVFTRIEEIHITHYHDDHTDYAQALAEKWQCPVVATPFQAPILLRPTDFHMPCLTDRPIARIQTMAGGESRRWHEFRLTKFNLPGQTLYHDGLLVERDGGERVFFAGDSFTPTGMDDYCLLNRNPVGEGKGFAAALAVLRGLPAGTLLINQHVTPVFRFSAGQIGAMEAALRERAALLKDLIAWPEPDFGVDEQWIRLEPHGATVAAGGTARFRAVLRNPARAALRVRLTPHLPKGWRSRPVWVEARAGDEGEAWFEVEVPASATGLEVLTADVEVAGRRLRDWCEAVVTVSPREKIK